MQDKHDKWGHRLILKTCKFCGKKKWMRPKSVSCSKSCNGIGGAKALHSLNLKRTDKFKRRQSKILKEFYRLHPEKVIRLLGTDNPAWKHGQARRGYNGFTESLKEIARRRDGNKCQKCGKKWTGRGPKFDVHHLDSNKNNSKLENLLTLCKKCHTTLHRQT